MRATVWRIWGSESGAWLETRTWEMFILGERECREPCVLDGAGTWPLEGDGGLAVRGFCSS